MVPPRSEAQFRALCNLTGSAPSLATHKTTEEVAVTMLDIELKHREQNNDHIQTSGISLTFLPSQPSYVPIGPLIPVAHIIHGSGYLTPNSTGPISIIVSGWEWSKRSPEEGGHNSQGCEWSKSQCNCR